MLGGLVAGIGVVVRCARASGIERQQLKWRAAGVVLALALFPLAVTERLDGAVALARQHGASCATLAIPMVRYRLWAIDTIIRRSAVYAVVTIVLVAGFAGDRRGRRRAGLRAGRVQRRRGGRRAGGHPGPAGAASGWWTGCFYGQRNEPYRALADVGRRLAAAAAPGEVLPAVVAAVASRCGCRTWRSSGADGGRCSRRTASRGRDASDGGR